MSSNYRLKDVSAHNSPDDLWMVIHNKVYDITTYLEEHPGGAEILVEYAGKDATDAFEDVGHSERAWAAMESLSVGELSLEEQREAATFYRPTYTQVETVAVLTKAPAVQWLRNITKQTIWWGLACVLVYHGSPRLVGQAYRIQLSAPSGGFWHGVLASAATFSIVSAVLGGALGSTLNASHNVKKYPSRQKASQRVVVGKQPMSTSSAILDPHTYRCFPLSKRTELSSNVLSLEFALPNSSDSLGLPTGQHVSVRADIDGKSVIRSYTPVSNDKDKGVIELIVKVYEHGKLTKHLASLQVGDQLEFRGPMGRMRYHAGLCKHIGMIAGGTGIAPMYQLIRAICEDPSDKTTVSLIYANNNEEDILLRDQLEHWATMYEDKFRMSYVLLHPPQGWKQHQGFVTKDLMMEKLGIAAPNSQLMLCGPPGMIAATQKYAGELGLKATGATYKATDRVFVF